MKRTILGFIIGGLLGALGGYWFASQQPRSYIRPGLQWQFSEAAGRGDINELKRLYARGAVINAEPSSGYISGFPALVTAAIGGHSEAVRRLIENGADVNLSPNDTPLACAQYRLQDTQKVIEILTAHGAK
jgi:hypothetical protein